MKILLDLNHPAHLNFFKTTISVLSSNNDEVIVTYLDRGRLPKIVEKEIDGVKMLKIGKHTGSRLSIIFQANILKFLSFIPLLLREKPNLCLSVGSFTNGFACKMFGIPNIQFDDDPERKVNVELEKLTSTELYFPPIIGPTKKIKIFNALKEWAYLSPKYFNPNKNVLKKYGTMIMMWSCLTSLCLAAVGSMVRAGSCL
ncbi:MAG: DUF354 domain-containing protein [Bacteroidetes bacterium]|nr:DUF354 domain-containing protein [Bacteroidota bacterium]